MPAAPRRVALVTALLLCGVAGSAAASPPPGRAIAPGRSAAAQSASSPSLGEYFTARQIDRSKRYNGLRYVLGFGSLALGLVALGFLALGPAARALGAWSGRVTGGRWALQALLLAGIVAAGPALVTLPLDVARNLYHERAWHLSTQSLGSFLGDWAKGTGFEVALVALAAVGFFGIVRVLPRAWPAAAAGFMVGLTVLLVVVYPLVYEPLFNRFTPVDPATRDRIVALAASAGVRVDRVLVADASKRTTKQNAYVSGLGATKRVVLYDTLLFRSSPREVDLVVAHELGHVVHRDVLRGTILGAAGAAGAVMLAWLLLSRAPVLRLSGAAGASDPRALPFLAFMLAAASFLTLPVANGFSRHIEGSADRFAVELTHDAGTAVDVEVALATANLSDLRPNAFIEWMFFSHPATLERIGIALKYGAERP